ncbi:MAG: TonB C-terminal domain-containing protein [Acidobacteriota bacterium]|nr:TonB C-terminal domain-containing protein [Acidobacteriota bacterium]
MESGVLAPSEVELNLLLAWPDQRTRPQWVAIFGTSVALHVLVFLVGATIPSLLGGERQAEPERTVVVRHIPLYIPPDVMTQRAPNRQKLSKQIDLADLTQSRKSNPTPGGSKPSIKHFELPKQNLHKEIAENAPPKILSQAPSISVNPNATPNAGIPNGLPAGAPTPPSPTPGPFQDIGSSDVSPNPHPKLVPPKAGLDAAVNGLAQSTNSDQLIISDDVPGRRAPGNAGSIGQLPAQHAAVELQSDPNGADFKAYLRNILMIVRSNWRRVVPESARMGTLRGRTVVEFIIDRNGGIPKLVMADSSGSEPLDRAAVAGLSMSNPLPPLPSDFKGFQIRLAFTFAYNMPAQ